VDACPFVEQGSTAVRWDGQISPCLPLLHTSDSYLGKALRRTHAHSVGSLLERGLLDLWNDPAYLAFRRRVRRFEFSPCLSCTRCELSRENCEDCLDSPFPTCGGCLWAQGIIQCP
jgi:MoaA/NifB/PqqE/SkfB family radical SAM enzyme